MNKTNSKKQQKQQAKQIPKNHGNFQKFIHSKTPSTYKTRTIDTQQEPIDDTNNVSKLTDFRKQTNQFSNYIDNSYKSTKKIRLFELDSDEEKQNALTHHGKDIEEIKNDFQISDSDSENEYAEKQHQKMMKQTNFGGFEEKNENQEENQKTKAEIYKEIIHKSKVMKYERQKLREENETKRLQLDQGYSELVPFLIFKKNAIQKKQPKQINDDYMQIKKSLEQEDVVIRPWKQVKKEQAVEIGVQNDDESEDDNEIENKSQD